MANVPMEETYTLAFQVKGKDAKGKEIVLGRRYHSRSAAETLANLLAKENKWSEVWVSTISGKDGIT